MTGFIGGGWLLQGGTVIKGKHNAVQPLFGRESSAHPFVQVVFEQQSPIDPKVAHPHLIGVDQGFPISSTRMQPGVSAVWWRMDRRVAAVSMTPAGSLTRVWHARFHRAVWQRPCPCVSGLRWNRGLWWQPNPVEK